MLVTFLLWSATFSAGAYAVMFTYGFLSWMLALFHVA